jgi:thiamine biosynthesis lipoprotein
VVLTLAIASAASQLTTENREMMGTRVTVSIDAPAEKSRPGFAAAFSVFEHIDAEMNEWKPGSALSRINDVAGNSAVEVPSDLCDLIRTSLEGARRTHGLFDPTWAALRDLWRFGSDQTGEVPDPAAVKARCPLVGWQGVEVTSPDGAAGCTVRLAKPGMRLGLGGVAKGWGVDRAVEALRKLGFSNFYVQAGGDLYAAGKKEGRPWRVGIRDPRRGVDSSFAILEISDAAFSTSGDYEHFFIAGGKRYHHIIDPRTCYPATASRSVTILAKTGTDAEFLTKAAFIEGGEAGVALADAWGAAAVIVTADNSVVFSKSLKGRLRWWSPHAE